MANNLINRIQYIDAMRGFTMIMVVFAHVLNFSLDLGDKTVIGRFFSTFRMPLFFFISGYISYKSMEIWSLSYYKECMRKKSFVQIIPALIFFTIYCLIIREYDMKTIIHKISTINFEGYWFTFSLFVMFIIYYTISILGKLLNKAAFLDTSIIILSILGVYLVTFDVQLPHAIRNAAQYFQFFSLGLLCKKHNIIFIKFLSNDIVKTIMIIAFLFCFYLCCNEQVIGNPFLYLVIRKMLVRYLGLFVCFMFFYCKRDYFNTTNTISNTLQFIGRRTLDIYLLHYFFIPIIPSISRYMSSSDMLIIQLGFTLSISLLIVGVCLLCSEVLRCSQTLALFLFGSKTRHK